MPNLLPLTLRRSRVDDAAALAASMADPAVFGNVLQLPYPSEAQWRERLAANDKPGSIDLSLVAERGGELVGSAGLFAAGQLLRRRHVVGLGISVAAHAQRQGVGRALMAALLDYADHWAPILRIELTVFADNAPAIALYQQFGFVQEGRMRGYALRDGRYEDCLSMARWHPSPPTLT